MTVTRWEITKFGADASRSFVALVMALPGSAGAPRAQLLHTGAGVERRDAHHARRADERLVTCHKQNWKSVPAVLRPGGCTG